MLEVTGRVVDALGMKRIGAVSYERLAGTDPQVFGRGVGIIYTKVT